MIKLFFRFPFQEVIIQDGGTLSNQVKYAKSKVHAKAPKQNRRKSKHVLLANEECVNDLLFLKHACSNNTAKELIFEKLNKTRDARTQILNEKQTDLREHFPYFLSDPSFVCLSSQIISYTYNSLILIWIFTDFDGLSWEIRTIN